jgi:hypothetical protein
MKKQANSDESPKLMLILKNHNLLNLKFELNQKTQFSRVNNCFLIVIDIN